MRNTKVSKVNKNDIFEKSINGIHPVIMCRVPIFAPLSRIPPVPRKMEMDEILYQTKWGYTHRHESNALLWEHRRLLLAIHHVCVLSNMNENGSLTMWLNIIELKRILGFPINSGSYHNLIKKRLSDMASIAINVFDNKADKYTNFHIITNYGYDMDKPRRGKHGSLFVPSFEGNTGNLYFSVDLSPEYINLFKDGLYIILDKKILKKIINIKNPIIASTIMFFLSHKRCAYSMYNILENIGALSDISTAMDKSRHMKTLREGELIFNDFGITMNTKDKIMYYTKCKEVCFMGASVKKYSFSSSHTNIDMEDFED